MTVSHFEAPLGREKWSTKTNSSSNNGASQKDGTWGPSRATILISFAKQHEMDFFHPVWFCMSPEQMMEANSNHYVLYQHDDDDDDNDGGGNDKNNHEWESTCFHTKLDFCNSYVA